MKKKNTCGVKHFKDGKEILNLALPLTWSLIWCKSIFSGQRRSHHCGQTEVVSESSASSPKLRNFSENNVILPGPAAADGVGGGAGGGTVVSVGAVAAHQTKTVGFP